MSIFWNTNKGKLRTSISNQSLGFKYLRLFNKLKILNSNGLMNTMMKIKRKILFHIVRVFFKQKTFSSSKC